MISQNDIVEILEVLRKDHVPFLVDQVRDQVANCFKMYRQLTQGEQLAIRGQFRPQHGAKLLRSAQELAVRAVRNNCPDDVAIGLLVVAVEGVQSDYRNTVLSLCLLHHVYKNWQSIQILFFTGLRPMERRKRAILYWNTYGWDQKISKIWQWKKVMGRTDLITPAPACE